MTTENHLNEFVQINPETRKDLQNTTEELLKVEHLDLDNRQYLASVLFCLGRYGESIEEFERILSKNENDEKIIAIPFGDPTYNQYKDIADLPKHIFDEMLHFFNVYKSLEEKEAVAKEVNNRDAAVKVIDDALQNYIETFCR